MSVTGTKLRSVHQYLLKQGFSVSQADLVLRRLGYELFGQDWTYENRVKSWSKKVSVPITRNTVNSGIKILLENTNNPLPTPYGWLQDIGKILFEEDILQYLSA